MQLLLDTDILIWFLEGKSKLSIRQRDLIIDGENDVYASIASLWEIAIKLSLRKLDLTKSFDEIINALRKENIEVLPITPDHLVKVTTLHFRHRDPFDRIIIAQAMSEEIPIMTLDRNFAEYGVEVL